MKRRKHLPSTLDALRGRRARGYIRESTVEQGSNSGPIVQRADMVAFAERHGFIFDTSEEAAFLSLIEGDKAQGGFTGTVYLDLASGSSLANRDEFARMLLDAKAGQFDVLLVRDPSRFGRNEYDTMAAEGELHKAGVVIVHTFDGTISSSRASRINLAVQRVQSAEYLALLSDNVARAYELRFAGGMWNGTAPIGYRMKYDQRWNAAKGGPEMVATGTLEPDLDERTRDDGTPYTYAGLVQTIGELYATGRMGARPLAAHLNAQGYRTVRGGAFSGGSIRHIIENPVYSGVTTWHQRVDKRLPDEKPTAPKPTHEPLWSDELWANIQRVRKRASRGASGGQLRNVYGFRRLVECDRCGRVMYGEAHSHRGDPAPLLGYGCIVAREQKACDQRFIAEEAIAEQVGSWLDGLSAFDFDEWGDVSAVLSDKARSARPPTVDTAAIQRKLERLRYLFLNGDEMTPEEYQRQKRALTDLLDAGAPLRGHDAETLRRTHQRLTNLGRLWADASPDERAELAAGLFVKVRVRDRDIVEVEMADETLLPVIARHVATVTTGAPPDGFEPPTPALGRLRSIH